MVRSQQGSGVIRSVLEILCMGKVGVLGLEVGVQLGDRGHL